MQRNLKFILLLSCIALSLSIAGAAQAKSLVVYFSMPETDKADNMTEAEDDSTVVINGKVLGNVQYAAQIIHSNTDSDIFRIEPKTPYTKNHKDLVSLAHTEQRENARPELKSDLTDDKLAQYDVIFLGYPIWWADLPMIVYTFLEAHDMSGKTIVPFTVHGGSGLAGTPRIIARLQPKAKVVREALSIYRDYMQDSEPVIIRWLKSIGY